MAFSQKQKLHKYMATTHKWIGLFVGLQIVFWVMGGVVMSWIPIEEVRGEHKVALKVPPAIDNQLDLLSFQALSELAGRPIIQLGYDTLLGKTIAKIRFEDGQEIRDAITGQLITPISKELAQTIAEADYAPDYPVSAVIEMMENNIDYRGPLPVWRVNFADDEKTSIYVSPVQARVVARRSSDWRLFDFFWMLHIMDYEERQDFNNPLLITFSISALVFALSGLFLLFYRFYRRDFNFILGRKKR
ncbi:PepSY domain-containing protein [Kordiimonas aquimaris]|uniref:PepSY domain-containing protein n=1 Tax=Kordiimonas aquimaris TaxID=707591 RepID=UPI0021D33A3A|nr:PepSY domain-containing protein [Kordiimonas aquimaris]